MPYLVEELGGDAKALGAVYSSFAIAQLASSAWMGLVSDRVGRRAIFLLSISASAAGMLGSALAPTYTVFLASRTWLGLFAGTMATANAYIAEVCASPLYALTLTLTYIHEPSA